MKGYAEKLTRRGTRKNLETEETLDEENKVSFSLLF